MLKEIIWMKEFGKEEPQAGVVNGFHVPLVVWAKLKRVLTVGIGLEVAEQLLYQQEAGQISNWKWVNKLQEVFEPKGKG